MLQNVFSDNSDPTYGGDHSAAAGNPGRIQDVKCCGYCDYDYSVGVYICKHCFEIPHLRQYFSNTLWQIKAICLVVIPELWLLRLYSYSHWVALEAEVYLFEDKVLGVAWNKKYKINIKKIQFFKLILSIALYTK